MPVRLFPAGGEIFPLVLVGVHADELNPNLRLGPARGGHGGDEVFQIGHDLVVVEPLADLGVGFRGAGVQGEIDRFHTGLDQGFGLVGPQQGGVCGELNRLMEGLPGEAGDTMSMKSGFNNGSPMM